MDVRLPRLGEGADSGTVATIFVKEGDHVKKDQPVLELESEKAVASIPSPADGTVTKLHVKEGDEIKVGQMILSLGEGGGEGGGTASSPQEQEAPATDLTTPPQSPGQEQQVEGEATGDVEPAAPARQPAAARRTGGTQQAVQQQQDSSQFIELPMPEPGTIPAASPSLRKMARELGLDLSRIRGSERGGRIVMADVRNHIQRLQQLAFQQQRQPAPAAPAAAPQAAPQGAAPQGAPRQAPGKAAPAPVDFSRWGKVERKKMTTLRRTISNKMVESWTTVPHITQFDELDVTRLLALRKKYAAKYEKKKAHLTLTSMALKALVPVLQQHPKFNASLDEAAGEIVYKQYYHIGVAVDTEQGLIVPVIRDVDTKSLLELSTELQELAERTRERKVGLEEMQGGSFTISNQGGIGSAQFTPIINTPEVAILGMGRSVLKPVVRGDRIEKRMLMPVGLSYDHRVIDGADAARFMVDLARSFAELKESDVKL